MWHSGKKLLCVLLLASFCYLSVFAVDIQSATETTEAQQTAQQAQQSESNSTQQESSSNQQNQVSSQLNIKSQNSNQLSTELSNLQNKITSSLQTLKLQVETLETQLKDSQNSSQSILNSLNNCRQTIANLHIDLDQVSERLQESNEGLVADEALLDEYDKKIAGYEKQIKNNVISTPIFIGVGSLGSLAGGIMIGVGVSTNNDTLAKTGAIVTAASIGSVGIVWAAGHWALKIW